MGYTNSGVVAHHLELFAAVMNDHEADANVAAANVAAAAKVNVL